MREHARRAVAAAILKSARRCAFIRNMSRYGAPAQFLTDHCDWSVRYVWAVYRSASIGCRNALAKLMQPCRRPIRSKKCRQFECSNILIISPGINGRNESRTHDHSRAGGLRRSFAAALSRKCLATWARLIYLASMRDYNTGKYHHDGLAARFSPAVARAKPWKWRTAMSFIKWRDCRLSNLQSR